MQERTLDKKFKIRKEANSGLAGIYKKHIMEPGSIPEATKKAVTWIKDKILHGEPLPLSIIPIPTPSLFVVRNRFLNGRRSAQISSCVVC